MGNVKGRITIEKQKLFLHPIYGYRRIKHKLHMLIMIPKYNEIPYIIK